jgi:Peptidase family M23
MKFSISLLLLSQIIIPAIFIASLFTFNTLSLFFLLKISGVTFYIAFIYYYGRWDWTSYYSRYLFPMVLLLSCVYLLYKFGFPKSGVIIQKPFTIYLVDIFVNLLFLFFLLKAMSGIKTKVVPISCDFPLRNGIFYIAHGGANKLINYHYLNKSQRYAMDILKLNKYGFRCNGIYPKELNRYCIYGEPVYAPADGKVIRVVSDSEDLIPPERDSANIAGNHIIIKTNEDIYMVLAHLLKGSINVKNGDEISRGQMIGKIGNSGNTSEPHLHIHCVKSGANDYFKRGEGIPILFKGKFLSRNSIVKL